MAGATFLAAVIAAISFLKKRRREKEEKRPLLHLRKLQYVYPLSFEKRPILLDDIEVRPRRFFVGRRAFKYSLQKKHALSLGLILLKRRAKKLIRPKLHAEDEIPYSITINLCSENELIAAEKAKSKKHPNHENNKIRTFAHMGCAYITNIGGTATSARFIGIEVDGTQLVLPEEKNRIVRRLDGEDFYIYLTFICTRNSKFIDARKYDDDNTIINSLSQTQGELFGAPQPDLIDKWKNIRFYLITTGLDKKENTQYINLEITTTNGVTWYHSTEGKLGFRARKIINDRISIEEKKRKNM